MNSRGKELPGNYNHILLTKLFHVQSSMWHIIAEEHLETVYMEISGFASAVRRYLIRDEHVREKVAEVVKPLMLQSKRAALEELQKL
jgi:hypothetical protein